MRDDGNAENLGVSPFKRDLSNDTPSSQTNLAGQSPLRAYFNISGVLDMST
jgi:hypothetical protein